MRANSDTYAAVVAQLVPVLVLAALLVPLRTDRSHPRALGDLIATVALLGAGTATTFAALFGVLHGGLSRGDTTLVTSLLLITFIAASVRVLRPFVSTYAGQRIPEPRVWAVVVVTFLSTIIGLFAWLG